MKTTIITLIHNSPYLSSWKVMIDSYWSIPTCLQLFGTLINLLELFSATVVVDNSSTLLGLPVLLFAPKKMLASSAPRCRFKWIEACLEATSQKQLWLPPFLCQTVCSLWTGFWLTLVPLLPVPRRPNNTKSPRACRTDSLHFVSVSCILLSKSMYLCFVDQWHCSN